MEENKDLVTEVTENAVEQPAEEVVEGIELTDTANTEEPVEEKKEEPVLKYTEEDFNKKLDEILAKKIAKVKSKLEKKYESELSKYKYAEQVLNAGLQTKTVDEAIEQIANNWKEQGIPIPEPTKPGLTQREIEILAKADAEEIIEDGIDEMTRVANELASKGYANLDAREKVIFDTLASRLYFETRKSDLAKNGVNPDILEDKEFIEFSKYFDPRTDVMKIYNLFIKEKPTKEVKPIGSMENSVKEKTVNEFFTMEEINRLTEKDYDDPEIMKKVERSLEKIYKETH